MDRSEEEQSGAGQPDQAGQEEHEEVDGDGSGRGPGSRRLATLADSSPVQRCCLLKIFVAKSCLKCVTDGALTEADLG